MTSTLGLNKPTKREIPAQVQLRSFLYLRHDGWSVLKQIKWQNHVKFTVYGDKLAFKVRNGQLWKWHLHVVQYRWLFQRGIDRSVGVNKDFVLLN